jgi:hypothetical protein
MKPSSWPPLLTRRNSPRGVDDAARQFEDSVLAGPHDKPEKARRRAMAMAEAKSPRGIRSDADGSLFRAAQAKAITARRAANRKLGIEHKDDPEFTASELQRWAALPSPSIKTKVARSFVMTLVVTLLGAVALLAVSTWFPALARLLVLR